MRAGSLVRRSRQRARQPGEVQGERADPLQMGHGRSSRCHRRGAIGAGQLVRCPPVGAFRALRQWGFRWSTLVHAWTCIYWSALAMHTQMGGGEKAHGRFFAPGSEGGMIGSGRATGVVASGSITFAHIAGRQWRIPQVPGCLSAL